MCYCAILFADRLTEDVSMGAVRLLILLICFGCLGCSPALAEKRVALVIGNSAYQKVPRLTNPTSDATVLAAMFRAAQLDSGRVEVRP